MDEKAASELLPNAGETTPMDSSRADSATAESAEHQGENPSLVNGGATEVAPTLQISSDNPLNVARLEAQESLVQVRATQHAANILPNTSTGMSAVTEVSSIVPNPVNTYISPDENNVAQQVPDKLPSGVANVTPQSRSTGTGETTEAPISMHVQQPAFPMDVDPLKHSVVVLTDIRNLSDPAYCEAALKAKAHVSLAFVVEILAHIQRMSNNPAEALFRALEVPAGEDEVVRAQLACQRICGDMPIPVSLKRIPYDAGVAQAALAALPNLERPYLISWATIEKGRSLGRGGSGEVFEAIYATTEVAIKELHTINPRRVAEIEQEARTLSKLLHPNCIRFYGYCVDDDNMRFGIVMERLHTNLDDFIHSRGYMPCLAPQKRVDILKAISKGLTYIHDKCGPHRDIKPLNILVSIDGKEVKIADFGLSGDLQPALSMGMTKAYAAPEVLMGAVATRESDIFSLGVLAFEVLSLNKPYPNFDRRQNYFAMPTCKLSEDFQLMRDGLLALMCAAEAQQRPGIATVADRLEHTFCMPRRGAGGTEFQAVELANEEYLFVKKYGPPVKKSGTGARKKVYDSANFTPQTQLVPVASPGSARLKAAAAAAVIAADDRRRV